MNRVKKHSVLACLLIFMICVIARIIEYFFIRSDKSFLAESFIHKLLGILLLFIILAILKMKWKDIGFTSNHVLVNVGKGMILGCICFVIAYGIECMIFYT